MFCHYVKLVGLTLVIFMCAWCMMWNIKCGGYIIDELKFEEAKKFQQGQF